MSRPAFFRDPDLRAELIARALRGETYTAIAGAMGSTAATVMRAWHRHATPEQHQQRSIEIRATRKVIRVRADVASLLDHGRRGAPWLAIGAVFYPRHKPARAAQAAAAMFYRHASPADRHTRARAIRALNFNKVPGLGDAARRRRDRKGIDGRALTERVSPWTGLGDCFT